jgi:hypothetical protein
MVTTVNTFEEQYEYAKNAAINAIKAGQNVVLWGRARSGKSHLMGELRSYAEDNDYFLSPELSRGDTVRTINMYLNYTKKHKWIMGSNCLDSLVKPLKYQPFVLISMDDFEHPKYSKLRSGKALN